MKPSTRIAIVALVALGLSACVAGSGDSAHAASGGMVSQFVLGLWHGLIGPLTLIVELVNRLMPRLLPWHAHLYETKAASAAYDLGFYLGLAGSPSILWSRWSRR